MTRKATTFRMEPAVQAALETLAKTIRRPMNQLVNEAVKDYVTRRGAEVERGRSGQCSTTRWPRI